MTLVGDKRISTVWFAVLTQNRSVTDRWTDSTVHAILAHKCIWWCVVVGVIQGSYQRSVVTMRTLAWTTLSILILSGVGGSRRPHTLRSRTRTMERQHDGCRCVPDQWEGVMMTTEHEFDFHDGYHRETGSRVRIYYDYKHRKFATRDLITGRRSVADYTAVSFHLAFWLFLLSLQQMNHAMWPIIRSQFMQWRRSL